MENIFYTYALLDPRKPTQTNVLGINFLYEPFYIGKGKGKRYKYHLSPYCKHGNIIKENKINSIRRDLQEPIAIILQGNLTDVEAFNLEVELIKCFGKLSEKTGILTNINDGGSQPPSPPIGREVSEETREKIRQTKLGTLNPAYGKDPWNKGTKGLCKPNKTSFTKGQIPWNKDGENVAIHGEKHWSYKPGKIKAENKKTKEEIIFQDRLELYAFFNTHGSYLSCVLDKPSRSCRGWWLTSIID